MVVFGLGLGAWILFVPPEIGAFVGPVALAGYAIGAALPFLVLAWCGAAIRRSLPTGRSLTDLAGECFGPLMRGWVLVLSLQDAANKRMINADAKLKAVLKKPQVSMFEMTKIISTHLS